MSELLWKVQRHALPAARVAGGVLGLAFAVLGVVLLFSSDNSAGALFVIGVAVAGVLYAAFAPRIQVQSFGVLGVQIAVRDVVHDRLEVARGSGPNADAASGQAVVLRSLGDLYDHVRRTQPPSARRTGLLDRLATEVRSAAGGTQFDPAEVATWFQEGTDALRFVALNVMLARPDPWYFAAVLEGIERSRSGFEQYYALRLGRAIADDLSPVARDVLRESVDRASQTRRVSDDPSRKSVAAAILKQLQGLAPPAPER